MAVQVIPLDDRNWIKFIGLPPCNPYTNMEYPIYFGLHKISSRMDFLTQFVSGSLYGRISPLSLNEAKDIANLASKWINAPITVVKELKCGLIHSSSYFEADSKTRQRKLKAGVKEEDLFVPVSFELKQIEHFGAAIQFFNEQGYLSTTERADLIPYVRNIEKFIGYHHALNSTVTVAQQDAMCSIAEPYIDAIIGLCAKKQTCQDFCGASTWCTFQESINSQDIARAILYAVCQENPALIFKEKFPGLLEGMDSGEELHKIYSGTAPLESTLRRMGTGLPRLNIQREILADFFEEKLFKEFGPESMSDLPDVFDSSLVKALRKKLFADGYFLDMIRVDSRQKPALIRICPFASIVDAISGDFGFQEVGFFQSKHSWYLFEEGKWIQGDAAKARFNKILSEVAKQLNEHSQE